MSYDLEVWSVEAPDVAAVLAHEGGWTEGAGLFSREGRSWQVAVSTPARILSEDVPDEVSVELPGTTHLTHISVSPFDAQRSARTLALKCARAIAKRAHGVVVDKQEGTVITPSGVKRFVPPKRSERFAEITLAWWFTDGPLLQRSGLDAFVDLLARRLPEALPRRYGLWEPPEHRLEQTGLDHFRAYLAEHASELIVWYPTRPALGVGVQVERAWGIQPRRGFHCSHAWVDVEADVLTQPGWQAGLRGLWREASALIRPFYGDVRTRHGLIARGATHAGDIQTQMGPVAGGWWRGIPRETGHAFVCGPEYQERWPAVARVAERTDGLAFIDPGDWRARSADEIVGPVPDAIAQRWTPAWVPHSHGGSYFRWNKDYPPEWPFGPRPPTDGV